MTTAKASRLLGTIAFAVVWAVVLSSVSSCGTDTGQVAGPPADTIKAPEPAASWALAVVVGDSTRLPLRWKTVCDALGCPDAFRLEYTSRLATAAASTAVMFRSVRVVANVDTSRIKTPEVGKPVTVCVAIRSERRGLLSSPLTSCRNVETADGPPPPPDSINWSGLKVVTDPITSGIRWASPPWKTKMGRVQYAIDTLGVVRDSAPVVGDSVRAGWTVRLCPQRRDMTGRVWIVIPKHSAWTTNAVQQYQRDCAGTVEGTPNWVLDFVTFTPVAPNG